jgi:hypothetical protein
MEASDCKLEGVEVLERVESQSTYCRGAGQSPKQLRESIGNIGLSSACINCDSHVLLSFTKKCEFGRTIDWKANKKFTRT